LLKIPHSQGSSCCSESVSLRFLPCVVHCTYYSKLGCFPMFICVCVYVCFNRGMT
jgi:hypothetical protein